MARLLDGNECSKEKEVDIALRPATFDEYIGQEKLKKNLRIFVFGAKHRNETLDHTLFYGAPGLGKTSLAYVIANEMNTNIKFVNGPAIEKTGDLAAILSSIQPGEILFIDEIHRLPKVVEEVLYSALEDFKLSILVSNQTTSDSIVIDLPPFTLIGATTRVGDISAPLRTRFLIVEKLDYYSEEDLKNIVFRTAKVFDSIIDDDAAENIAKRSRGTPRVANRLFRRVRDFANYYGTNKITNCICDEALNSLGIDPIGLDEIDIKYLNTIIFRFNGGPVGLESIANTIGEVAKNLEDVYEPFLLRIGFINRTQKGREVTNKCISYLKRQKRRQM